MSNLRDVHKYLNRLSKFLGKCTNLMLASAGNCRWSVVLNLLCISYPYIKQDFQIDPQCTQWWSFIKNAKLTNLQFRMIF